MIFKSISVAGNTDGAFFISEVEVLGVQLISQETMAQHCILIQQVI